MRFPFRSVLAACLALACSTPAAQEEVSTRPGINDRFLSADLDVEEFTKIFESESREIFAHRREIVGSLGLKPGMAVADIGAGTGLFLEPMADAVGPGGKLYAVEIAPRFVEHLRKRAQTRGLRQVEVVLGGERSVELPESSIDLAFVCDTYHHFEYPRAILASIRAALRPGGRLILIDFERIPGISKEWVSEHVRAGKAESSAEIQSAGFALDNELKIPGLVENYILEFRRR